MNLKGIILSTATLIISIFGAWIIAWLWSRKKEWSKKKKIICFVIIFLVIYISGAFLYFGKYFHATDEARQYLVSTDTVSVTKNGSIWFFDGNGRDEALVFYPGAKVEAAAYAHIMYDIAESGVDCYLVDMPLHMAFLGRGKAAGIIAKNPDYETWYMGGHSLGGAMASLYTATHPNEISGLYLLAAYSTAPIDDSIQVVTLLGSEDSVIQMDMLNENRDNLPQSAVEIIIEGGNHAQFGDYGQQPGDGVPTISADEQKKQSAEAFGLVRSK